MHLSVLKGWEYPMKEENLKVQTHRYPLIQQYLLYTYLKTRKFGFVTKNINEQHRSSASIEVPF
jgi:hypothetical protein